MKKRQAKKIMAYSFLKILRQNLTCDEELKALDLLNSKSKYWFEKHWKYAPVGKRIRDAALSTFIHHYTFAAKSKSIKYDSRRTI